MWGKWNAMRWPPSLLITTPPAHESHRRRELGVRPLVSLSFLFFIWPLSRSSHALWWAVNTTSMGCIFVSCIRLPILSIKNAMADIGKNLPKMRTTNWWYQGQVRKCKYPEKTKKRELNSYVILILVYGNECSTLFPYRWGRGNQNMGSTEEYWE